MAGMNFECDTKQALNRAATSRARVGYLMAFSGLGGLNLKADMTLLSPFNAKGGTVLKGDKVTCVGIIEKFAFAGEKEDPMRIVAYLTTANAAALRGKMASGVKNTKVKFSYAIADFDLDTKKWFEAACVDGDAKAAGAIDTMNGVLQISLDGEPKRLDPAFDLVFYRLSFQAAPEPKASAKLRFATGATQKVIKSWGA
jgi:hypothetical protein